MLPNGRSSQSSFSFEWLLATANPTLDLEHPLKGPFETMREGRIDISKASLELCKEAQLLPASIVLPLNKATFDVFSLHVVSASATPIVP